MNRSINYERLEPGQRYTIGDDGVPVLQKSRCSNRGLVIEGVATKYDTILYNDSFGPGRFINIQPGAFAISLKYEPPVECWLDHDSKLALTGCRVELFDDKEALSFRVHLNDSETCTQARALVECGSYSQVSLGWHSSKTITRDIEGKTLTYIVAGVLTEVSLVPAGAVKTTHCQVSELSRCATLAHDCKSLRFQSDNDFVALRRAFQKMESEND